MNRLALALVVIVLAAESSCSWLYGVRGPPDRPWPPPGAPREEPCATSAIRPLGDVIFTVLFGGLAAVGVAAAANADCDGEDCWVGVFPEVPTSFALLTGGFAVLFGFSASYGFGNVSACRAYKSGAGDLEPQPKPEQEPEPEPKPAPSLLK